MILKIKYTTYYSKDKTQQSYKLNKLEEIDNSSVNDIWKPNLNNLGYCQIYGKTIRRGRQKDITFLYHTEAKSEQLTYLVLKNLIQQPLRELKLKKLLE